MKPQFYCFAGALLLLTLAKFVDPAYSRPLPPLQAFVLQQGDVPHSFVRTASGLVRNADIIARHTMSATELRRDGRVIGYDVVYSRRAVKGITGIRSEDVLFKTSQGAAAYYRAISTKTLASVRRDRTYGHLSVTGIGSRAFGYSIRLSPGGPAPSLTTVTVLFQRGAYIGVVGIAGRSGTFDSRNALPLAQIIDSRFRKAG
ncbi:MAG: hypothetical protein NVSMB52_17780 [Chloroflexota bacterium]